MAKTKKSADGGPAFPFIGTMPATGIDNPIPLPVFHVGMTLADYFAAQILSGWLVSRESDVLLAKCAGDAEEAARMAAEGAYVIARAMLAARSSPASSEGGG